MTNKFHIFLDWLHSLGGEFTPVRDLSEPKPRTGRRDPDKRARDYPLTTDKYTINDKGVIRRKVPEYYPEAGE